MKNTNNQKGLSLIELMIAMVVSLVLVAGVSTVYMSSKRNYQARDQLSLMDETARIALNALTKHLEHAGYATSNKISMDTVGGYFYVKDDPDPKTGNCDTPLGSNVLSALKSSPTQDDLFGVVYGKVYGDAVSTRFIGDDDLRSDLRGSLLNAKCLGGNPDTPSSLIYNAFHVDNDGSTKDCSGGLAPILYGVGSNSNLFKSPIVNGVENIQFLYGVDANTDGNVDQYLNATDVSDTDAWQQVISIKVGLLIRSLEPVLPEAKQQSYQVLDETVEHYQVLDPAKEAAPLLAPDRCLRSVYTTVIHLRNVVEG